MLFNKKLPRNSPMQIHRFGFSCNPYFMHISHKQNPSSTYRLSIRLIEYNLRCNIIGSTTKSLRSLIAKNRFLTHAKIGNLNMTICIQQNIVQLQISIDDSAGVKKKESYCNLCGVENRNWLLEFATLLNLKHQISPVDVFHYKV